MNIVENDQRISGRIREAWAEHAPELTKWAYRSLYPRDDTYPWWNVNARNKDGEIEPGWRRKFAELNGDDLLRHFKGQGTIGTYTLGRDNHCLYVGVDIDAHDGQPADPEANLAYAMRLYERLEGFGARPLLEDSNGKGGFHVWCRFDHRIPGHLARSIVLWLVKDAPPALHVEAFPKQAKSPYGNQMRLPGRHHKRDHYSRFWDGSKWLEGDAACRFLLDWAATAPAVFPEEARQYLPPKPPPKPPSPRPEADGEPWDETDGHWVKQFDGDLRTLDVLKLCDDRLTGEDCGDRYGIVCPWHDEHSTGDGGTCVWVGGDGRYPGFNCLHAHCRDRKLHDLLEFYGKEAVDKCCDRMFGNRNHDLDDKIDAAIPSPSVVPTPAPSGNGKAPKPQEAEYADWDRQLAKKTKELPAWTEGVSAADLDSETIDIDYIVERLLAVMPTVIGGRLKSLKTLVMLDLAVSLASGTKFLDEWKCQKVPVAVWSGESGRAAIQNALRRIYKGKGIKPSDCLLKLHFTLPPLYSQTDMDILAGLIRRDGRKAVFIDPAYLCLLNQDTAGKAGNIFVMGNALRPLSEVGNDTKCLVGLCHHFGKWTDSTNFTPAELAELSQAGMAEWAGNWLLLARRAPYLDDGKHLLYLTAGNRCGTALKRAIDVDEGPMDERGHFRTKWDVRVTNLVQAAADDRLAKIEKKQAEAQTVEAERQEKVVEFLTTKPGGETAAEIKDCLGINDRAWKPLAAKMLAEGVMVECQVAKRKQSYAGYRLA
jgi:hypothetical protein